MRYFITLVLLANLLIAVTNAASELSPEESMKAQSYLEKGVTYFKKGDLDTAESYLQQSTELNSQNAIAFYYLGSVKMAKRDFQQARASMAKAIELDRTKPALGRNFWREAEDALGLSNAFLGDFKTAKKIYLEAIEKDPDYPGFTYNLACVCAIEGDRQCALESLRASLKSDAGSGFEPMLPDPQMDDDLKGLLGDPEFQANLIANLGPQPNDGKAGALVREGAQNLAYGNYDKAVSLEREAIKSDPDNALAWYYLGGSLMKLNRAGDAADAFVKSLQQNVPPNPPLSKAMIRYAATAAGRYRIDNNDAEGAVPLLKKATEADAFHPTAYYLLARAYALMGMKDKAGRMLVRAFEIRENLSKVEKPLPDPSMDSAFEAFRDDKDWTKLISGLGGNE